jgi:hypothetical protein
LPILPKVIKTVKSQPLVIVITIFAKETEKKTIYCKFEIATFYEFLELKSAKILLLPSKCEMNFVTFRK